MRDKIILVDEQDNEIGFEEKMKVHQKGQLHRAFSVFIFDWLDQTMLIQKRAFRKYHSGGLWTNACCSHPRLGEEMTCSICSRLKEELGFTLTAHIVQPDDCALCLGEPDVLYCCGKFQYFAQYKTLSENEIDHVYLYSPVAGTFGKNEFKINHDEIDDIKWISIEELSQWLKKSPNEFTAWFERAFNLAYNILCRQVQIMDNEGNK